MVDLLKCIVTLTANAGVILLTRGIEILIDALHSEKVSTFSTTPPEVLDWVKYRYRNCSPRFVLGTHGHSDHISPSLWEEARRFWPDSIFISPGLPLGGTIVLKDPSQKIILDDIIIDAKILPHDGVGFKDVTNYGYFLDINGLSVLIPGDCATTAFDDLEDLIAGRRVDLALVNFPWVTLTKPRAFILNKVAPAHLAVFHLPLARDDCGGYRAATRKAVQKLAVKDITVLSEPLQQVIIS